MFSFGFSLTTCSNLSIIRFHGQAVDVKQVSSLNRDDLKKICGDNFPEWISFPVFEQVRMLVSSSSGVVTLIVHSCCVLF